MFDRETITFTEASRRLGVDRRTVSDMVARKKIKLHPLVPGGPNRALDADGFRELQEALRPTSASA